ncbi:myrosinase 1-like [Episyrphus balteatus]|uniref:myrosinase 1-like n=1 Tax=Episyrphus balteatus TaxID=286459 RepID=UPI002485599E|nr:myrosinase 1-like [Episyrphus balteatus]XP_055855093.1 myrosinase 1-like [Episyrphus balteatus]
MWSLVLFLVLGLFGSKISVEAANCTIQAKGNSKFPNDFTFGVATSAYQIEGGWNADGKGLSIWDEYTHNYPDRIKDRSNGDSSAESYRLFDLDLKALKDLGVNQYRFSIAWTRIFPIGHVHLKNQKGIDYYNSVIDKLLANGIEPIVTMYHWDMPVDLQKFGGFSNSQIVEHFSNYAEELFKLFGDRVKIWITLNEPHKICKEGYGLAESPPLIAASGVGDYICYTNLLKAHGATYRLYKEKFAKEQKGKVGISLDCRFYFSKTNNTDDIDRAMQYTLGLLAHPIFSKTGDFPAIVLKEIEKSSLEIEGRKKSRLPSLGEYWTNIIKGSADFMGVNYYTSRYVTPSTEPLGENPSMERDQNYQLDVDPNWPRANADWMYCVPEGLENLLKYIRDEYDNVEVKITENGWPDSGEINDDERINYFKSHIQAVLNAVNDGCNTTAYSAWSLIDNFEWNQGYTMKFGLFSVDMRSAKKERTPKKSALLYKKIIETKSVPDSV